MTSHSLTTCEHSINDKSQSHNCLQLIHSKMTYSLLQLQNSCSPLTMTNNIDKYGTDPAMLNESDHEN